MTHDRKLADRKIGDHRVHLVVEDHLYGRVVVRRGNAHGLRQRLLDEGLARRTCQHGISLIGVVEQRCADLGWHYENDDESDALGVLDYALSWLAQRNLLPEVPDQVDF